MATLLYRTLQLSLEYDTIIWHTCVMTACRQKLYVQNCGQTAADRDMFTIDRETLSLSFVPGRGGGGSLPWLVPGSFRGVVDRLWEKHEQTPAMNSQEPDHGGGVRRFAGPVRSEASGRWSLPVVAGRSVDVGPRHFHHEKLAGRTRFVGTRHCPIQRYHRWLHTTYRLATVHVFQTDRQRDDT